MHVCLPLTCPFLAAVESSAGDDSGYYDIGDEIVLTCVVESSVLPSGCSWATPSDPSFATSLTFRFGNFSCGNFQVT